MTDPKSTTRTGTAGGSTWALPLLPLAPVAAINQFTDRSTPWLVISWVCCALSAVLVAAGWSAVSRHGMRTAGSWVMCILAHAVLVVQLIRLIQT